MAINNPELFLAGVWEWTFLDECFSPTRIRVSDVDGEVERNGYFLVFEGKSIGAPIPKGQEIKWKRQAATGLYTIIVAWGEAGVGILPAVEAMQVYTRAGMMKKHPADNDDLVAFVRHWFLWVNSQPLPKPRMVALTEDPLSLWYVDYHNGRYED